MFTKTIKELDLFSLPFNFSLVEDKKYKKTLFGGIVSLVIISLSIAYLIYLCFLYFGHQLQPNISVSNVYFNETFEMNINENAIAFKLLVKGQNISDLQKDGKTYVQTIIKLTEYDEQGVPQEIIIPAKVCEDEDLNGYYCIDYANLNEGNKFLTLGYFPGQLEKQKITLLLLFCTPKFLAPGQYCASNQDIQDTIIKITTQIYLRVTTSQYSTSKRVYEKRVKEEKLFFSAGIVQYSKIHLQKTSTSINTGFIIQTTTEQDYLSDYYLVGSINTYQFLKQETGFDIINITDFFISDNGREQKIQFPQFTYVFAQFSCVFNSLLAVGIICKLFAQTELVSDFIELQLKIYYKKTAMHLIEKLEKSKIKKQNSILPELNLFNLYQKIQRFKINEFNTKQLNVGYLQKLKYMMFKKESQNKNGLSDSQDFKIYKELINTSNKVMNIFEIQKELTKVKMMLRMLLSVEQYAALQLCGLSINFENEELIDENRDKKLQQFKDKDENLKVIEEFESNEVILQNEKSIQYENYQFKKQQTPEKQINCKQEQQDLLNILSSTKSHLEKIDMLERNDEYFQQCLERYFVNNQFQSELDKRILRSMIGSIDLKLKEIKNTKQNYQIDKHK